MFSDTIYPDNRLDKILTEEGYISFDSSTPVYHYFLTDHLGNNRVVLNQDGSVEQVNHYYPFGGLMAESTGGEVQPWKFGGKELDTKKGLNWADFGKRQMDNLLCRWTSLDPEAEKYYSTSPYVYTANNPLRNLDLQGDSITVLNLGEGPLNQHMAILIQNDAGKWSYYSVNGDNAYIPGTNIHVGGREFDDLGEKEFDSPQQFLTSYFNSAGDKNDTSINSYGFPEGYIIPTTPAEDAIIRETLVDISVNEKYNVLTNNCAHAVQRSLQAAGVKTGKDKKINGWPGRAFKNIVKNNTVGTYINKHSKK